MSDIKLFVCCHQPFAIPPHPLLVPVQVGAALAPSHFDGFLHDDCGENISAKNRSYCELTAQYWAWKNVDADYYGFFHYRRFLFPRVGERLPYRIKGAPTQRLLHRLGFDSFGRLIAQHDLVVPLGEDMHITVRDHYANAPYHHRKDLALVEQILLEQHPEMAQAAQDYLSGTICYFGNIYIMSKPQFHDYCRWLFSILDEFDRRADLSDYSAQELRVDGYLAERLFGIWLTWLQGNKHLRILSLPRVHWVSDPASRLKQQVKNLLLPPGSLRRAKIKHWTWNNHG